MLTKFELTNIWRNYPSLLEIAGKSRKGFGLGTIPDPGYWAGCGVDEDYLNARGLFILWQEIWLQEQLGELPVNAGANFLAMIERMDRLYPDLFWENFAILLKQGFRFDLIQENGDFEVDSLQGFCGIMASAGRKPETDRKLSNKIKQELWVLVKSTGTDRIMTLLTNIRPDQRNIEILEDYRPYF